MIGEELRILRMRLHMTQTEAGSFLGIYRGKPNGVSLRTWQGWEWGHQGIPDEVIENIRKANHWLDGIEEQILNFAQGGEVKMPYYKSQEDWVLPGREKWEYKPYQAALAKAVLYHHLHLVPFDKEKYGEWLGERNDSELERITWSQTQ